MKSCQACGGEIDLESFPMTCNRIACRRFVQAKMMREAMPVRPAVSDKKIEEPPPILAAARPLAPTELDPQNFGAHWEPTFVGLNSSYAVPAGTTLTVESSPMLHFRPTRLVVTPMCASQFDLIDFKIGHNSQTPGCEKVACEAFPPIPADIPPHQLGDWIKAQTVHCDVCFIGMRIKLTVFNKGHLPSTFQAVLWGEADFR